MLVSVVVEHTSCRWAGDGSPLFKPLKLSDGSFSSFQYKCEKCPETLWMSVRQEVTDGD